MKTFLKEYFHKHRFLPRYLAFIFTNRAVVVSACIMTGGFLGLSVAALILIGSFFAWGSITLPFTESPITIFTLAFIGGVIGLYISETAAAFKFWRIMKAEAEAREKEKIDAELKAKADAEAQREAAVHKFPFPLPAGTTWQQITMQFHDDENVIIRVNQWKHTANYIELGLCDGRGKTYRPSEQWRFLKVLAGLEGKISVKNLEAKDTYKKQKQLLSEKLKEYFNLDYDPFRPYHEGNSYRTKMTLLPKPVRTTDDEDDGDVRNDALSAELRSYFAEQASP